jgi:cytochrome P450
MTVSPILAAKPDHVPAALVSEIDLYNVPGLDDGHTGDIHRLWKNVQDSHPDIFWTPLNGGHWLATRHDTMARVAVDAVRFSSRDIFVPKNSAPTLTPANSDPPEHSGFRKLLMPTFSPAMLAKASDRARDAAIALIERLRPNGGCEFVSEFSKIMPIVAFMTLVDLPLGDLDYLQSVAGKLTPRDPESAASWAELSRYVNAQIDARRHQPGDDFLSTLLTAQAGGRKLTEQEIFNLALQVISGGLDTVAISLTFVASFLAQNPHHREQLVGNPDLIERAVEEFLRRFGVANLARVAVEDTELDGVTIKAGESLVLLYPLAGLDERANERPLEVDFHRKGAKHLIFGTGIHTCIGNRLAKREMRLFLEEWLKRIPSFSLAPNTIPKAHSGVLNEIEELHLVWDL